MVLLQLQDRSNINENFFKLIQTKYCNDSIATEYLHNVSSAKAPREAIALGRAAPSPLAF